MRDFITKTQMFPGGCDVPVSVEGGCARKMFQQTVVVFTTEDGNTAIMSLEDLQHFAALSLDAQGYTQVPTQHPPIVEGDDQHA